MKGVLVVILIFLAVSGLCWLSALQPDRSAVVPATGQQADTPRPGLVQAVVTQAAPLLPQVDTGATAVWLIQQSINADDEARAAQQTASAAAARRDDLRGYQTATQAEFERQQLEAARAATAQAEELARQATAEASATAAQQAWIVQGWTATADSVAATSQAAVNSTATAQWFALQQITVEAVRSNATATAVRQVTADAMRLADEQRTQRSKDITKTIDTAIPYLVGLLVIAVILFLIWKITPVVVRRLGDRMPNAAGLYPLLDDRGTIYDPQRNMWPIAQLGKNPQLPATAADAQERTTARAQAVLWANGGPANRPASPAGPAPRIVVEPPPAQAPAPVQQPLQLPETAPWSLLDRWPGGKLVLGIKTDQPGIVEYDPEGPAPHLLLAGTSGSGKSRYGLRSIITEALADRWQVVILDRSGVDFQVFAAHPNAHLVRIDQPQEAIGYLKSAYAELIRRLRAFPAGVSTWSRSSGSDPRVLIVVDEFSNLADDMDKSDRERLWQAARMLAAEGRKAGLLLAIALQDPTHESIDLRIRRNCTRIAFRVQEAESSRVVLGAAGAECLPDRQFMTVIGTLQTGLAFAPTDEQIRWLLARRNPPALPDPAWLRLPDEEEPVEGEVIEAAWPQETVDLASQIRAVWEAGGSKRAMARAAGGEYAGGFAAKIDRAIEYLGATTATGSSSSTAGPAFRAVPAE